VLKHVITTSRSFSVVSSAKIRQISLSDLTHKGVTTNYDDNTNSQGTNYHTRKPGTVFVADKDGRLWTVQQDEACSKLGVDGQHDDDNNNNNNNNNKFDIVTTSKQTLALMLPAGYPKSVAPNYSRFAGFCFTASIAGSAAMVLSTQTLLLAVGVVGQNVQQASIMAGAWNWVMKDFVGQLGGVIFAGQMGKTRAFDSDPKRWRMVAAMALDGATLLEILSPLFHSSLVLPVASIANIGKNIGFLTASASRAALHNAVAITGNLGDVTAKAGSQSIMASLIGTSLGIGLSSLLQHDTYNFALGFLGLTIIHQGCNYLSVQYVPLAHFNKQRVCLVVQAYINNDQSTTDSVLSPSEVAQLEQFFPLTAPLDATKDWLRVGRTLSEMFPEPSELHDTMAILPDEPYLIRVSSERKANDNDGYIDLVFFTHATGEDAIKGLYHACLLRKAMSQHPASMNGNPVEVIETTHREVHEKFPALLDQIHAKGWNTSTDVTHVEGTDAFRLQIE
jgi:hypothetical protein